MDDLCKRYGLPVYGGVITDSVDAARLLLEVGLYEGLAVKAREIRTNSPRAERPVSGNLNLVVSHLTPDGFMIVGAWVDPEQITKDGGPVGLVLRQSMFTVTALKEHVGDFCARLGFTGHLDLEIFRPGGGLS